MRIEKIIFICLIILVLLVSTVCADDVENEVENDIENQIVEASAKVQDFPNINSRRYVVFDRTSKQVLFGKNENVKGAMASTTKIMTAIVVLENANLDEEIQVSAKSAGTGGSRLGLKTGDKITINNLLYGLMLRSGNDAAVALAESVGGSVSEFADMMNEKAKDLHLTSTHFVTPHGLDNSEHYTTAVELAKIADYAMENEMFCKIVGTKIATIYINGYEKQIANTNELLGNLNGVVGIKTGFTNNAGRCLVTETRRDNMDIIVVVLGADTKKFRTQDSVKLIEYTYSNYEMVDVENLIKNEFENWKNINLQRIKIIKGKSNVINLRLSEIEIKQMAMNKSDIDKIKFETNCMTTLDAPINENTKIGTMQISLDGKIIESVDLLTNEEITKKEWKDYFAELLKIFRVQTNYFEAINLEL